MLISATATGMGASISKDNKKVALFLIAFAGKTVLYLMKNLVHSTDSN
jgi:hypothetical protein